MGLGKLVTGGELGAVTTDDEELYERIVSLGSVKAAKFLKHYTVDDALPFKSRPHGLALAIGTASLTRLEERNKGMKRFAEGIFDSIADVDWLKPQRQFPNTARTYYRVVLCADKAVPLDLLERLREKLRASGIPAIDEEYVKPLTAWNAITGVSFLTTKRFAPPSTAQLTLPATDSIIHRTLHFWGFADPSPSDLPNKIGEAIRLAAQELGIKK